MAVYKRSDVKILTIDDDPSFNRLLAAYFKKLKFKYKITSSADEFLSFLKKASPHLCFVDLNLERGSGVGYQLIQAIRNKLGDELPIIVLSSRISEEDIAKAFDCGASDYLPKPINLKDIDEKVQLNLSQKFT